MAASETAQCILLRTMLCFATGSMVSRSGQYMGVSEPLTRFGHPALHMDGRPLELAISQGGGACGVWVERNGQPTIELAGLETVSRKHE